MKRTYENALKLLESRRRTARPKGVAARPITPAPQPGNPTHTSAPNSSNALRGVPSLVGMREWLQLLGHSDDDINKLNIIHITGTKGKGSTCAFTRSFLRAHGLRTGFPSRIGLYTSPDLRCIRERIQIDNKPIGEDLFTQYFFEVWDRLTIPSSSAVSIPEAVREKGPRFLQFLAIVAFHAFINEKVDAAIFETHHGGEYDATNFVQKPVVTGITSLGMDHVAQLGPTVEDIAWHKAGIFKTGAPAFSVPQKEAGSASEEVMRRRAAEKGTTLEFVPVNKTQLPNNDRVLSVPVQQINCSLALDLARAFVRIKAPENTITVDDITQGVTNFSWPGRFEIISDGDSQWFLDGAHNTLSLKQAAEWFSKNVNTTTDMSAARKYRILIFSHFSDARDGEALVDCLGHALLENNAMPDHVIFTTYHEREDGSTRVDKFLKVPETPFPDFRGIYSDIWKKFDPKATISSEPTIEEALNLAKSVARNHGGMDVFVTGSLHLVGGALNVMQPDI